MRKIILGLIALGLLVSGTLAMATSNSAISYKYSIQNETSAPDLIVTQSNWYTIYCGQQYNEHIPYTIANNGISIDLSTNSLNFASSTSAGILAINEVGGAPNTVKLIAVTPDGFFLASPTNEHLDDFQLNISNTKTISSIDILPYESIQLANANNTPIYKPGSFTIENETSSQMQGGKLGITCKISVLSDNGIIFVGNKNNTENYLSTNNIFSQDYLVKNTDSAAIIEIQELIGVPLTTKFLVITANGVYNANTFDPSFDDFEIVANDNSPLPSFTIIPWDSESSK